MAQAEIIATFLSYSLLRRCYNCKLSHLLETYIADLPTFFQAICLQLSELIHKANSTLIEEKKWGSFSYATKKGLICGFYPTKNSVTLRFYFGAHMHDSKKLFIAENESTNTRSMKFSSTDEVKNYDSDITAYIKEAIQLDEIDIKVNNRHQTIKIPADLKTVLHKDNILDKFETMSYTMKKEYIAWIMEAKKEETKQNRIKKAIQNISIAKGLYDKYK